ncbi:MAG: hypothetical protein AABN33_10915 [Acidobacteriota bacterium]
MAERERIYLKEAGEVYGEQWIDYRLTCEAVVIWTFASPNECIRHSDYAPPSNNYPPVGTPNPTDYDEDIATFNVEESDYDAEASMYLSGLVPNPQNPCQLIKPIKWRVDYGTSLAYFERRLTEGFSSIQRVNLIRSDDELIRLQKACYLFGLVLARRKGGRQPEYDDSETDIFLQDTYDAYIETCNSDATHAREQFSVAKIAPLMRRPISRDTWIETRKRLHLNMRDLKAEAHRQLLAHRQL